ncbi:hypothetical protein HJC23_013579 [Cyclotella cryptica]|uniref:Enoyl reductase (ER) domain-containing protein n=1 Tax=Cyclotella cryptica TaxID=29204 RepID=A0ABD3PR44_9STRA|eukprot:CCRYP_012285-RA/>CCRYP_012285-RA protein AED:0.14 eAED:0.14 QI:0/-1/0/1/-1/1/1/0/331
MKAVVRTGIMGWTISFKQDHPAPPVTSSGDDLLRPNEVLLRVKSAAINPVDYKLPRMIGGTVVGLDVSGIVEKVGKDVTSFEEGDHVFGRAIDGKGTPSGSLAEWAVANMEEVAKKPNFLQFDEAAALPTAYLTGINSLRDAGKVREGSSVLVIGASGGCGLAGVQLAKAMGAARVVGICSGKNFDFVRTHGGIEELVDYTDDAAVRKFVEENAGKFDCIYDTATGSGKGEDYVSTAVPTLLKKETGEYVQINGKPSDWLRKFAGMEKEHRALVLTKSKAKSDLELVATLLEATKARPYLNVKNFDETGVKDAFEQLKERRTKGKMVFNIE